MLPFYSSPIHHLFVITQRVLSRVSHTIVTGPSLTKSTSIFSPNRPSWTLSSEPNSFLNPAKKS